MRSKEEQFPEPFAPDFVEVTFGANDEWVAAMRFVPDGDGRPILAELRVFAAQSRSGRNAGDWSGAADRPVTTVTLRELKLGQTVARGLERLFRETDWWVTFDGVPPTLDTRDPSAPPKSLGDMTPEFLDDLRTGRGKARPAPVRRRDDQHYARIASLYVQLDHSSKAVAERLVADGEYHAEGTVRRWVSEARRAGLLSGTTAGKKGGRLTPKGERLARQIGPASPGPHEHGG